MKLEKGQDAGIIIQFELLWWAALLMHSRGCRIKPDGIILGRYGDSEAQKNLQTVEIHDLSKYRVLENGKGKTNCLWGKEIQCC
jgi:hypothetical protein